MKGTITSILVFLSFRGAAQESQFINGFGNTRLDISTEFFSRDSMVGSPFLSSNRMYGVVELITHQTIPEKNKILLFNYNKLKNILISTSTSNKIKFYPRDSILRFVLVDTSMKRYFFEKITSISDDFFLMPILESEAGYSVFKRIITKLIPADYRGNGYFSTGNHHDTYTDDYEYYILYPDKTTYRKFFLTEGAVKKALKDEDATLIDLVDKFKSPFTEKTLIEIVAQINVNHL